MIKSLKGTEVLVTGAEGFIGSHLSRRLCSLGANVHIIVHPKSSLWRIEDLLDKVKVHPVDLFDRPKLKRIFSKMSPVKIFHLAANTDHRRLLGLFDKIFRDNVRGTLNLIRAAEGSDFDCFINTGTCEEYGLGGVPFKEEQRECPVSPYSLSKVYTTYTCTMLHRSFALPIVTLRPFLSYGPAQDTNMFIPSLILSCLKKKNFKMTKGKQTREFNFVDDIVEGYIRASITPKALGKIINLGNGREYEIVEIAGMIRQLCRSKIRLQIGALSYRQGERMRFFSSPQQARRILRWRSKVKLKEGLARTINWYQQHYQ
jgi:nucleoside-diphosphate-sugar epimerase